MPVGTVCNPHKAKEPLMKNPMFNRFVDVIFAVLPILLVSLALLTCDYQSKSGSYLVIGLVGCCMVCCRPRQSGSILSSVATIAVCVAAAVNIFAASHLPVLLLLLGATVCNALTQADSLRRGLAAQRFKKLLAAGKPVSGTIRSVSADPSAVFAYTVDLGNGLVGLLPAGQFVEGDNVLVEVRRVLEDGTAYLTLAEAVESGNS